MSPSRPLLVALFSLVGAASVNAALLACSSPIGTAASLAPEKVAAAQEAQAAPRCATWEIQAFMPTKFKFATVKRLDAEGRSDGVISLPIAEAMTLPDGWEPFAAEGYGAITARRCVQ